MMKVIASPKCREKSLRVSHKNRLTQSGSAWPLPSELEKGHREKSQSGSFCREEMMVHEEGDE